MFETIITKYRASQNAVELNKLIQMAHADKPRSIVVLGTDNGDILRVFKETLKPEVLIGIDTVEKPIDPTTALAVMGNPILPEIYDKVVDILDNRSIDLLFLNHDKTFDGLKNEYFLYRDLVRTGGIIAMDGIRLKSPEYHLAGIDVSDFWHSIIKDVSLKYYEFWDVSAFGYGPGIGMLYKL